MNDYQQFDLKTLAQSSTPVVLYGPPGTGKSRLIDKLVEELRSSGELGLYEQVQFHRKFGYEDFIEGFSPTGGGFEKRDGIFLSFCKSVSSSSGLKNKVNVFAIDEINRADISSTFGELLYAMEDRIGRTVKTSHFSQNFSVPTSLFLVATMNTADKNIANIDYAVRRRFTFIPVFPSSSNLQTWLSTEFKHDSSIPIDAYVAFFRRTNARITKNPFLGSHMQFGEATFVPRGMKTITDAGLAFNFLTSILPQLESFLGFGNLNELEKIFNPEIAKTYISSRTVPLDLFAGLINEAQNDKDQ